MLRSVRRTIFVSSAPFVFPAAPAQYVFCDQICFIIMFSEIMFMIYCCRSKPTGEQRQATRRAGRSPGAGRHYSLVDGPQFRHAPGVSGECRACHLTYTRSGRCERASNDLPAYKDTCKHKSEPWRRLPGTTLASALKIRSKSRCQIRSMHLISMDKACNYGNCFN